jgi:ribosomal protein L7/L12
VDTYTKLLSDNLAAGASVNEALTNLKAEGATTAQAIKAVHLARGVSLGQAKELFAQCPAWAGEVEAGQLLHQEILSSVGGEKP